MLKRFIAKLEDVEEALRGFYKKSGDGFVLQVDGKDAETEETITGLKNAKEHEKNLRVSAEGKISTLTTQLEEATTARDAAITERDAAKSAQGTDVAALEASWQKKVDDANTAKTAIEQELTSEVERLLVTNTATAMAHKISTVPELFQDTIAKRLKVEKGADGKYFTRVLDATGNPSAVTLDELEKELLANDKYAAIMIAGKGSGGGAGGPGSGGGAGEKKWLEYSDAELVELRKTDPEKYDRLKQAHSAAPAA